MIKITDTFSNSKKDFAPREKSRVGFFVCGPTVYDNIHIGNAKTYVVFDVIVKYLRYRDHKVFYLQNITDIDDKIITRAKAENRKYSQVATEFTKNYLHITKTLKIDSVSKYAKATDHLKEIIRQVERLIEKGYAYSAPAIKATGEDTIDPSGNSDVYFNISKFQEYGRLSKQNLTEVEVGTRKEIEQNKKDPRDFVLWKAQNYSYEPTWKSPWGMGRPGWHIEDTAISEKYLGDQYDIHGGGADLMFPHHEAEIAQQEAASGKRPFVNYWLHSGLLILNEEKMSKSLGNFITAKEALENHSPEAFRMMAISSHYRSPLSYREKFMHQFDAATERLSDFMERLKNISAARINPPAIDQIIASARSEFIKALDDDFNTPVGLAAVFELVRNINGLIAENRIGKKDAKQIQKFMLELDEILGIIPTKKERIPREVIELVELREKEREAKNWEKADDIRQGIEQLGYIVEDTNYGPYVKKR